MSPDDRKYTKEHEWVMLDGAAANVAVAGITDFAQDQLGDIVFFELPKVGDTVAHLGKMGEVESVKAVSALFSPVDGVVTELNEKLLDAAINVVRWIQSSPWRPAPLSQPLSTSMKDQA